MKNKFLKATFLKRTKKYKIISHGSLQIYNMGNCLEEK